ncbi:hypothetical protein CGJ15_27990, partial [Vibrio parahaemolyticus]
SAAACLLTHQEMKEQAAELPYTGTTLFIDDQTRFEEQASDPATAIDPNDPAYIMYTSGTTGKPKGNIT